MKSVLVERNGTLMMDINGTVYAPLAFRSFRPEKRNIAAFYQAGVRLMSVLITGLNCTLDVPYSHFGEIWLGNQQYDFTPIDRQMALFMDHAPDAYFNIMLQFDTRDWYLKQHPGSANTFLNLVEMAGSEQWRADVTTYLQDVIGYLEEKYGERIFAYSMFCGGSTEWYTNSQAYRNPESFIRYSPLKEASMQAFYQDKTLKLPDQATLSHTSNGIFRDPVADQQALLYWRFHHQIIGDTIVYFAGVVKEIVDRKKLVGLFYGYLMELTGTRLLYEGQLGYEKVWRCPDIDMIFEPAAYGQTRRFEGVSGFLHTVDATPLHRKLTIHELDHTTYIAPQTVENGRKIPGSDAKLPDACTTISVLRREFAMTKARRTGMWWFDFFGGYYDAPELMAEVGKMTAINRRLQAVDMKSVAQVAVFGDVPSMYFVSEFARINEDCLRNLRDSLGRLGAPYDLFTFSDLDQVDLKPYKLCIFLNTFHISAEAADMIRDKVEQDGRSLLWIYAPGYITETGFSTENMSRITGITLAEAQVKQSAVVSGSHAFSFQESVFPLFKVQDDQAEMLGHYAEDGTPALAVKSCGNHTAYYSAVGNLPHALLRSIARRAGVHLYYEGDDPVYVNSRLFGIHAVEGGVVTLCLPEEMRLEELFDGGQAVTTDGKVVLNIPAGDMKLYLLTPVSERS